MHVHVLRGCSYLVMHDAEYISRVKISAEGLTNCFHNALWYHGHNMQSVIVSVLYIGLLKIICCQPKTKRIL